MRNAECGTWSAECGVRNSTTNIPLPPIPLPPIRLPPIRLPKKRACILV
jgi:hypothetical protein